MGKNGTKTALFSVPLHLPIFINLKHLFITYEKADLNCYDGACAPVIFHQL